MEAVFEALGVDKWRGADNNKGQECVLYMRQTVILTAHCEVCLPIPCPAERLHTATREAFQNLVTRAVDKSVDLMVIAGDV